VIDVGYFNEMAIPIMQKLAEKKGKKKKKEVIV